MKYHSKICFIFTMIGLCLCTTACHTSEKTSSSTPSLKANVCTEAVDRQVLSATGAVMAVSEGSAATGATLTVSPGTVSKKTEPVQLETGRIYEINKETQFSLSRISTGKTIWASLGTDYYYENPKEGQVYIDLVLEFTNNSKKALPVSSICSLSAKNKKGKNHKPTYGFP